MVNKPKVWSNEQVTDYSMNQNICMPLSPMDLTDNTSFSTTSATYVNARTLAVGANQVSNYIIIRFDMTAHAKGNSSSNITEQISAQVTIEGVQKIELTLSTLSQTVASNVDDSWNTRMVEYKYTPSAAEIAAGFTINLDIKATLTVGTGSDNGSAVLNNFWTVWGA
jgi:hypothetical protein